MNLLMGWWLGLFVRHAVDDAGGGTTEVVQGEEAVPPAELPADMPDATGPGTETPTPPAQAAPIPAPPAAKETMIEALKAGLKSSPEGGEKPAAKASPDPVADGKGKAAPDKPADKKPGDPYAMPDGLAPRAQQRFQALVGELKERDAKIAGYTKLEDNYKNFHAAASEVGAGAPEMTRFFDFMGKIKSGDAKGAIAFLDEQRAMIAKEFGIATGPEDTSIIDRYPDIKADMEAYKISKDRAIELAEARASRERGDRVSETQRAQQDQADRAQAAEEKAIDAVSQWAAQVAKTDIDFPKKREVLFADLAAIVRGVPHALWLEKIQAAYRLLGSQVAPAPKAGASGQPLRASTGSGVANPSSMMEAIKAGLTPGG